MKKNAKPQLLRRLYVLLCLALLLAGAALNLPTKLCNNASGTDHLDWWSNDLLIADLMYSQNYGSDTWEIRIAFPPNIQKLTGQDNVEWVQSEMFRNNQTFDKDFFVPYSSNLVAQRYLYKLADAVLPVSNGVLLKALYLMNALLLSLGALLFLLYLERHTAPGTALFGAAVIGVFGLLYDAMAKNLYWVEWSLFAPPLAVALLLDCRKFAGFTTEKQRLRAVFWAVFAGCTVKQLMYFEFVTSAMIAATVPAFVYLLENRRKIADWVHWYLTMIGGAVASFVLTFGLKTAMLIADRGVEGAWSETFQNLLSRVSGLAKLLNMTDQIGNEDTREATNVGVGAVLQRVGSKVALLFNASFGITIAQITAALLVLTALAVVLYKLHFATGKAVLWVGAAWYAMLAPLSWFVMAKEHTWLHSTFCTISWYVPGAFVIAAAFSCCVADVVKTAKERKKVSA